MTARHRSADGGVPVRFTFDDVPLEAVAGQSIAAALIAAGRRTWRTTRHGDEPRGAFCGIGACFDCLAVVNGRPNVRTCLAEAADGDVVLSQSGTGRASGA